MYKIRYIGFFKYIFLTRILDLYKYDKFQIGDK